MVVSGVYCKSECLLLLSNIKIRLNTWLARFSFRDGRVVAWTAKDDINAGLAWVKLFIIR